MANLLFRTGRVVKKIGKRLGQTKMTRKIASDERSTKRLVKPAGGQGVDLPYAIKTVGAHRQLPMPAPVTEIEPYEEVARLIAGGKRDAPAWFAGHLRRWAPSLFLDSAVSRKQPGRAEVRKWIEVTRDAARFLRQALVRDPIIEFLEAEPAGKMKARGMLLEQLKQLTNRAELALKSSALVTEKGVTKAGRGSALPPGATSPHAYCAALIAEAWKYLRGEEPAPRNNEAQRAAAAFWAASRAESFQTRAAKSRKRTVNNPETRWRPHLEKAKSPALLAYRAEFRRHMFQCESYAEVERTGD
jgi:hypothetical protein